VECDFELVPGHRPDGMASGERNYASHIEAVCGGAPGASDEVCVEYRERSPIYYAEQLAQPRLLLAHGRSDKSVPFTHGWNLAQAIEKYQPREHFFYLFDGGHEAHFDHAFRFFDQTANQKTKDGLTGWDSDP
jgi:hypothetical protein